MMIRVNPAFHPAGTFTNLITIPACTFTQFDQVLRCPLARTLYIIGYKKGVKSPGETIDTEAGEGHYYSNMTGRPLFSRGLFSF